MKKTLIIVGLFCAIMSGIFLLGQQQGYSPTGGKPYSAMALSSNVNIAANTSKCLVNLSTVLAANCTSAGPSYYAAPNTGTIQNFGCQVQTAPGAGYTDTCTLYVNESATSLTCNIANTATACTDTNAAHNAAVTLGQAVGVLVAVPSSAAATSAESATYQLTNF